jgi:hypothetical protein
MTDDLIAFAALIGGLTLIGLCAYLYHRNRDLKEREKPLRRRHF